MGSAAAIGNGAPTGLQAAFRAPQTGRCQPTRSAVRGEGRDLDVLAGLQHTAGVTAQVGVGRLQPRRGAMGADDGDPHTAECTGSRATAPQERWSCGGARATC